MSYMTLSSQPKHLSLLCSYFRAHPTTLLNTTQNIGRTYAWAVPPRFIQRTARMGYLPLVLPDVGVGAATDSRQHFDSRVGLHSSLVVAYSRVYRPYPGVAYSRVYRPYSGV